MQMPRILSTALLASSLLFAACGDDGGTTDGGSDSGVADTGEEPFDSGLRTCPATECPAIANGRVTATANMEGTALSFDCDMEVAERDDRIFLETPNTVGGTILCKEMNNSRIELVLDIRQAPCAEAYTDPSVVRLELRDRDFTLRPLSGAAANVSAYTVTVDCWDKANLRISGSFSADWSEAGADMFNGYGSASGTFSVNLLQ